MNIFINPFKIINIITAIGTLTIAYFSWKAYDTIIGQKINEKQLEKVLELLEYMKNINFTIYGYINETFNVAGETNLIELSENYSLLTDLSDFNELFSDRVKDINYCNIFASKSFMRKLIKLSEYSDDPLLPKEIASDLKLLKVSIQGLEAKKTGYKIIDDDTKNNTIKVQLLSKEPTQKKYFPYVAIDNTRFALSLFYNHPKEQTESPYYSWINFRKYFNNLIKKIKSWLKYNNVKDINLP